MATKGEEKEEEKPVSWEYSEEKEKPTNDDGEEEENEGAEDVSLVNDDNVEDGTNNQSNESKNSSEEEQQQIPIEEQLYEVNMDDPDMDPLEWTVRKLVPIPKAYFWETNNTNVSTRTKMWHRTVATLANTARAFESAGGVVANVFGLYGSKYDYVTSTMTEEQWEEARKTAQERKKKRKEYLEKKEMEKKEEDVAADVGVSADAL
eukprot:CAMPEP_0185727484 /NCGR_PEP_ID=MMETSP1171-20130828/3160_1 /TAXON_ID=374046 /ORGANISM="Helicotheca tamensis, Strain CCMP826" /LENGTH=205 /DNA_ID=CAMNT_0028396063 /DNA_START=107 /DNA_END=724 /DNA_ORIENTATION=+